MPEVNEITLAALIGGQIRAMRQRVNATQEDVAARANQFGLGWKRNTVAQLELGLQEPTAGELLLLPLIMSGVLREPVELDDLLDSGDGQALVTLGGETGVFQKFLVAIARRAASQIDPGQLVWANSGLVVLDEATEKAARRLGLTSADVHDLALELWRQGLVAERERRLEQRPEWADASPRSRQAMRGQVTRQLLDELRRFADIEED